MSEIKRDLLIGLPEIDQAQAKRLGETMRAVRAAAVASNTPPPRASEADLRQALTIYCRAWADLRSLLRNEVTLFNWDQGRDFVFDRTRLLALEQQIERLEGALGLPVAVPRQVRRWA